MGLSTTSRRLDYIGDNATAIFPYTFKIFAASHLKVYRVLADGTVNLLVLGAGYTLSGVGQKAGGTITLSSPLLDDEALIVLGVMPLDQKTDIKNQGDYYPNLIEDRMDLTVMQIQQVQEQVDRSIKLPLKVRVPTDFSAELPAPTVDDRYKVLRLNLLTNAFEYVDPAQAFADAGGGAGGTLELPTDGDYGGANGNPSKVAEGDTYEDAFDKVATLLSKLTPTPPDDLREKVLRIIGSYQGLEAGSGIVHLLTDLSNPVLTPGIDLTATLANSFGDPDAGTLEATLDGASVGLVTLTAGDDSGLTDGQLAVLSEFDPYAGQGLGKQDIFKGITARIQGTGLAVGAHTAELAHSLTGATPTLEFYVDDPVTPVTSVGTLTATGATTFRSGVPGMAAGSTITAPVGATGAVGTHYNQTQVLRASSGQTTTVNYLPTTPPAAGATVNQSLALTVLANVYSDNVVVAGTSFNSKGVSHTVNVSQQIRVDLVGSEASRLTSSTGQYPASGYGAAFDSTVSLLTNKELQYRNGVYLYPPLVSYTGKYPAGPDYTGITPDSYANMRWVTFSLGSVSNVSSVTFAFQGAVNFGGSTLVSGLAVYVRVDGAAPTAGWIDANAAYPGVGNPSANGDPALDVGNSTALSKRVTFGATVRTGTVFVRIGIPSGSTKSFGGIA